MGFGTTGLAGTMIWLVPYGVWAGAKRSGVREMCDKAFLGNQAEDEDGLNWGRVNMIEKYKG